jgi:hypothetical protein
MVAMHVTKRDWTLAPNDAAAHLNNAFTVAQARFDIPPHFARLFENTSLSKC